MTSKQPEIRTPRLLLRPPIAEDFEAWARFHADKVTMEHLGGVQHPADAWRGLASLIGMWDLAPAAMFCVIEAESGEWVGRIGPHEPHQWPCKEVGWGILREHEGKGYALEAAVASLDFAFRELGWDTVSHLIATENTRSAALAKRLGAYTVGEATMPGSLSEYQVTEWRQRADEWWARRDQFEELVPVG